MFNTGWNHLRGEIRRRGPVPGVARFPPLETEVPLRILTRSWTWHGLRGVPLAIFGLAFEGSGALYQLEFSDPA